MQCLSPPICITWVPANIMLVVVLWWTCILSRGSRDTSSCLISQKLKLVCQLAGMQTWPFVVVFRLLLLQQIECFCIQKTSCDCLLSIFALSVCNSIQGCLQMVGRISWHGPQHNRLPQNMAWSDVIFGHVTQAGCCTASEVWYVGMSPRRCFGCRYRTVSQ